MINYTELDESTKETASVERELLVLTVALFMHEHSWQIVGKAGQFLSDGCRLAPSLAALSSSSPHLAHLPTMAHPEKELSGAT